MLKNCIVAIALLTSGAVNLPTTPRKSSAGFQQKYPPLSSKQRLAIQVVISASRTSSGFGSPVRVPDELTFRTRDPIHVGIVIANSANESATVCAFSNPYYQNRPELKRNGQVLVYQDKLIELVHQSDLGQLCEIFRSPDIVVLEPNVPMRIPSIELQDWYGVLAEGHYELTLKRTFACCADGNLNASNSISFDVLP